MVQIPDKTKRLLAFIMTFLIIFAAMMPCAYAADDSKKEYEVQDKAYQTAVEEAFKGFEGTVDSTSFEIDKGDTEDGFLKGVIEKVVNALTNIIWGLAKGLAELSAEITNLALKFNLYDEMKDEGTFGASSFTSTLNSLMRTDIVKLGIALTLAIVVFQMVMGRMSDGFGKAMHIFIVVIVAFGFLSNPFGILGTGHDLATDMGEETFTAIANASNRSSGANDAQTQILKNLVVTEWRILEFGDAEGNEKEAKKILSYPAGDADRQEYAEEISEIGDDKSIKSLQLTMSSQTANMVTAIGMLLINLMMFVVFGLVGLLSLGFQLLSLLVGLMGIFVLPLSLLPFLGLNSVKRWAMLMFIGMAGIVLAFSAQGMVVFLLTVCFNLVGKVGFALAIVIFAATFLVVWVFRWQILGIFSENANQLRSMRTQQRANNRLARRSFKEKTAIAKAAGRTAKKVGGVPLRGAKAAKRSFDNSELGKANADRKALRKAEKNMEKTGHEGGKKAIKAEEKAAKSAEKQKARDENAARRMKAAKETHDRRKAEEAMRKGERNKFGEKGASSESASKGGLAGAAARTKETGDGNERGERHPFKSQSRTVREREANPVEREHRPERRTSGGSGEARNTTRPHGKNNNTHSRGSSETKNRAAKTSDSKMKANKPGRKK